MLSDNKKKKRINDVLVLYPFSYERQFIYISNNSVFLEFRVNKRKCRHKKYL